MNRRHLAEGQKAVLANEYMRILSKKCESEAGKKAVTIREIKRGNIDEETVSQSDKNEANPSHKKYPDRKYVSETVSETYNYHSWRRSPTVVLKKKGQK